MAESQAYTQLAEHHYDDPSQLSQLLQQRAGSDRAFQFTTSTESHSSGTSAFAPVNASAGTERRNRAELPLQLHVATAHVQRAPSPRRATSTRYVKPALPTSHSAPTSIGVAIERAATRKMPHSFGPSIMDAPGDTQPDSQMHSRWASSTHGTDTASNRKSSIVKSLFIEHVEEDEDVLSEESEVVESSQEHQSATVTSPTVIHEDELLGALPMHNYALTSPLKFETPAVAGRKRDSSGQLLSSAVRTNTTPGTVISTSAFPGFGNGGIAAMSLTQAWHNTQAPTSPLAEAIDDPAFTRPSPNFTHARHSSPLPVLSSPTKACQSETPRTDPVIRSSSEPRAEYVSMKESQERRRRTTREIPIPAFEQEDSWERPSAAQLRMQKLKARQDFERGTAISFANVSAPTPPSAHTGKKRTTNNLDEAAMRLANPRSIESTPIRAPQPILVNVPDGDESLELSQEVPLTTPAAVKGTDTVQVPQTSSHAPRTSNISRNSSPSSQLQHESQLEATTTALPQGEARPHSSKDSVAITDSQPDATITYDSIPRPKSLRFPSSPSTNQYSINQTTMAFKTGYTSQVISSSIPPMPPGSSQDDPEDAPEAGDQSHDNGDRVPSSPPIVAHEDDLTYDEHEQGYDEYTDGEYVNMSTEPHTPDNEVIVGEDDGSPVAKQEADHEADMSDKDELDLIQPQKAEPNSDQEVTEDGEQEIPRGQADQLPSHVLESDRTAEAHSQTASSRMERQNTIPETDGLEETQPSMFPPEDSRELADQIVTISADISEIVNETNNTEPFHTAREEPSRSQTKRALPASSTEGGSDNLHEGERLRSLEDFHNIPETQQSNAEEEIEIPRLSGFDETEEDTFLSKPSPAPPSPKRRKITYTAKKSAFRSPMKSKGLLVAASGTTSLSATTRDTESLSDVPSDIEAQNCEAQDALAATHEQEEVQAPPRRAATLKTKVPARQSKGAPAKKGSLRTISRDLLVSLSSPSRSPAKADGHMDGVERRPETPSKRRVKDHKKPPEDTKEIADIVMPDADNERDELGSSASEPTALKKPVLSLEQSREILVPNRVLASWPGSHYYPATYLGKISGRQLQIRYDDGNINTLDTTQVRSLDFRPGDHVKVDEPGMKKHTYIVVGFKDKLDDLQGRQFPITDNYGHATIVLEEKQRDSLPASKAKQPPDHVSVPVGSIYLTTQLWTRFRNRAFNISPAGSPSKSNSRLGTPVAAMDAVSTPSFIRKATVGSSHLRDATTRAASVASSSARSGRGTFVNMAFVLTSTAADIDKEAVAKLIKANGGSILEQGFHELFDLDPNEALSSSQSRRSPAKDSAGLSLKQQYKDLGFVALISDSHSRSTKYIQALALNVPCLHLRWVHDSLSASRAVPFAKYLLPAGVSKFLDPNGVVRSRTMSLYDPSSEDTTFAHTIAQRDLLLHSQAVLLVTGRSKKEIEKRQPFVFLTHALGSANVGRCANLAAAREMLNEHEWNWVYVDNGEQGVADAASELFGTGKPIASGKPKKGKKRKRDVTEEKEELVARGLIKGRNVKITCSEFVVQSLILGALVED